MGRTLEWLKALRLLQQSLQSDLNAAIKSNQHLTKRYNQEQKMWIAKAEELERIQTKLEIEQSLRKEAENSLSETIEFNRILEDKYELEQNDLQRKDREYKNTLMKLGMSERSLNNTKKMLEYAEKKLRTTRAELKARQVGNEMWRRARRISSKLSGSKDRNKEKSEGRSLGLSSEYLELLETPKKEKHSLRKFGQKVWQNSKSCIEMVGKKL